MKRTKGWSRRTGSRTRAGAAAMEVVLILMVTFPIAMVCFWIAKLAAANAYQVISSFVGSPYY